MRIGSEGNNRGIDVQQQKEAELGRIQKTAILTEVSLLSFQSTEKDYEKIID